MRHLFPVDVRPRDLFWRSIRRLSSFAPTSSAARCAAQRSLRTDRDPERRYGDQDHQRNEIRRQRSRRRMCPSSGLSRRPPARLPVDRDRAGHGAAARGGRRRRDPLHGHRPLVRRACRHDAWRPAADRRGLNRHHVPIWDEALTGMRVGGQRRMLVPPSAIPNTQASKVPGGDRMLRFDIEVIKTLSSRTRPLRASPCGCRRTAGSR